jgi:gamma-glutamyltranspeptidase/glutathione hydrolase
MDILARGGNAVDAAVATAFALGVVDPASSGIGGGGFMVIYQSKEKKAHALDFRETAPSAAHKDLYLKDGQPVPGLSLTGPLAVAVPGQAAGLAEAWKRFGSLPWPALLAPAIRYAAEGFPTTAHLHSVLERQLPTLSKFPDLARVFLKGGAAPGVGQELRQPELGATLKAVAEQGAEVFYRGWIAQAIAERLSDGGILTLDDLKGYKPRWREPILGSYRNQVVITMPPPSSGGIALVQMFKALEAYPVRLLEHNSATYVHLITEAMKHAFADRAQYLGDPEQFWRLCDANAAMHPEELTDAIGRTLRITLPEGIPGAPNA